MAARRAGQVEICARIVIERPVAGVRHSLQEDDAPLDPKTSVSGEALSFEFSLRVALAEGTPPKFAPKGRKGASSTFASALRRATMARPGPGG